MKFWAHSSYFQGIPSPLYPLKGLRGAGFAKSVRKILMANNLGVKILSAKDLRPIPCSLDIPSPPRP